MRPHQTLRELEDFFAKHRSHLQRKGVGLTSVDNRTVVDVYLQWVLLTIDLGYFSLCSNRATLGRIISDLLDRDVYEVVSTFADCVDLVRNQQKIGFKARLAKASPHIWGFVKHDVFASSEGDTMAAKRLLQLFSYTTRLSLKKINLSSESLEAYLATENGITDELPEHTLKELNAVIKRWMKPFDGSDLRFGHGNGSVAGHRLSESSLEVKYKDMFTDSLTRYAYPDHIGSEHHITSTPDRLSQTVFVAKSYKAFRTISKEPSSLMYLQQGVWRELDRVMLRNPYLRDRINVHDQTRNQKMARAGSFFRNYATIDLAAASDSVSWTLVKRVFRGTKVLRHLFATRSTHTFLPNNEFLRMKKFAPMGSALCFPIQTIIFAAICEIATKKVGRMRREKSIIGDYSVYGDDIIVPTQTANEVIHTLKSLGFTVNSSKSFVDKDSWFRESCGGEYCNGDDVTPQRVSRNYTSDLDGAAVTGCVDSANEAYRRGYSNLRHFFLRRLHYIEGYIPLFSPTSLLADNYTNYHTKKKRNHKLQYWAIRYTQVKSKTERGNEELALRHWLEVNQHRKTVVDAFVSAIGDSETKLGIDYGFGPQTSKYEVPTKVERQIPVS